ncbi:Uncharacterised protein [Mycobacteroides abscessus subsp. abscessus]|nr:Uncharacterised protein [Mycobacteroides abscessus]SHS16578.1 Uncharacterised protein [Mycobacteroides abscessus subsp. abscessus]CPR56918.1 Uncharacterised protein [Mycobacteroides abscessus]CPS22491.1 Uncharacterised protein [Mycobacteroides abscessus]CPU79814.1 Uncharacterised protein [Mycobacteroides abscessus]
MRRFARADVSGQIGSVRLVDELQHQARALWVHPRVHQMECTRFLSYVVAGPEPDDCSIWVGAIGADGYGRFFITRSGSGFCVRPNRYALAMSTGRPLDADVFALHDCDNPICVKISPPESVRQHVVSGTQSENMLRMGRGRRGGGRPSIRGLGREARRERSVALRDAVRDGWDAEAVREALLGVHPRLF